MVLNPHRVVPTDQITAVMSGDQENPIPGKQVSLAPAPVEEAKEEDSFHSFGMQFLGLEVSESSKGLRDESSHHAIKDYATEGESKWMELAHREESQVTLRSRMRFERYRYQYMCVGSGT